MLVAGWNLTNEQKEARREAAAAEDYAQRLADGFEAFENDEIVREDEME